MTLRDTRRHMKRSKGIYEPTTRNSQLFRAMRLHGEGEVGHHERPPGTKSPVPNKHSISPLWKKQEGSED